jgi:hypothetical protein
VTVVVFQLIRKFHRPLAETTGVPLLPETSRHSQPSTKSKNFLVTIRYNTCTYFSCVLQVASRRFMLRQAQQGFSHSTVLFLIQEGISHDRCYYHSLTRLAVRAYVLLTSVLAGLSANLVSELFTIAQQRFVLINRIAIGEFISFCTPLRNPLRVSSDDPPIWTTNWFQIAISSYLLPRPSFG